MEGGDLENGLESPPLSNPIFSPPCALGKEPHAGAGYHRVLLLLIFYPAQQGTCGGMHAQVRACTQWLTWGVLRRCLLGKCVPGVPDPFGESNGRFSLTECPRHRHFRPLSPMMCVLHNNAAIHFVQWAVPYVEVALILTDHGLSLLHVGQSHMNLWNTSGTDSHPRHSSGLRGSVSAPGVRPTSFFFPFPTDACFCPLSPNNRANFGSPAVAALSYNVGVVGNDACVCNCACSHICETDSLVPVCGNTTPGCPLWSTWGTSLGEDKPGARARILKTKVPRRACAGRPLRG